MALLLLNTESGFTLKYQMKNSKKELRNMNQHIWEPYPIQEQIHISDMYSLFQLHYDNDYAFFGETHNFWECLYVIKGRVCVSADERIYYLEDGEIIFHKPMELHKFTIESPEGADLLIFSYSAEGNLTVWLKDKVFKLSDAQINIIRNLLSYMQEQTAAQSVKDIVRHYLAPFHHIPNYSQMVAVHLYQLFLSLANDGCVSTASTAPDAVVFRKAINYLNNNLTRQPTVAEVTHFCNVSLAGLKRTFDKYAGIGVHQYLLKLKIKAAIDLLESGESVTTVAERTGFNNQSYFSKAFKRETGKTPSEYKH